MQQCCIPCTQGRYEKWEQIPLPPYHMTPYYQKNSKSKGKYGAGHLNRTDDNDDDDYDDDDGDDDDYDGGGGGGDDDK